MPAPRCGFAACPVANRVFLAHGFDEHASKGDFKGYLKQHGVAANCEENAAKDHEKDQDAKDNKAPLACRKNLRPTWEAKV